MRTSCQLPQPALSHRLASTGPKASRVMGAHSGHAAVPVNSATPCRGQRSLRRMIFARAEFSAAGAQNGSEARGDVRLRAVMDANASAGTVSSTASNGKGGDGAAGNRVVVLGSGWGAMSFGT